MENYPRDPFDRWLFHVFKFVLFVIGLYWMWQFLEGHVPVKEILSKLFGG